MHLFDSQRSWFPLAPNRHLNIWWMMNLWVKWQTKKSCVLNSGGEVTSNIPSLTIYKKLSCGELSQHRKCLFSHYVKIKLDYQCLQPILSNPDSTCRKNYCLTEVDFGKVIRTMPMKLIALLYVLRIIPFPSKHARVTCQFCLGSNN